MNVLYSHRLPNVCVFCELYCLQYVFYAFCKASVQYVFLPFSAILTNLILFIFHAPNTTVLLFTVRPFFVICLFASVCPTPFGGAMSVPGRTHT